MDMTQAREVVRQIGLNNILSISGGPTSLNADGQLVLPVGRGYSVRVILDEGSDTYTVQRVYTRAGVVRVKGERTWVYCDEVGEVAYRASCYHDDFVGATS